VTRARTGGVAQSLRRGTALALTLALAGCHGATDTALPMAQKSSWETSFNRGDSAAVAALYAPDAELVMSGSAPVHGRESIRAAVDKLLRAGVKLRIETARAEAAGDLAYFYGPYSVSAARGVVERGTYLEVWRRTGTRWRIELDVNATGEPITTPQR
jgi:uncharacterized protein (TIGR02246 family)